MKRGSAVLLLDLVLILLGTLLGAAINFATNSSGHQPPLVELFRQWSLPAAGMLIVLLLGGRFVTYYLEKPLAPLRIWNSARSPYPGLEAFSEDESAAFFGRESEISLLLERLHPAVAAEAHRVVSIIGPSGSGKSSIIQAGLLPRLAQRRSRWVVVPPFVPEHDPIRSLHHSLIAALSDDADEDVAITDAAGLVDAAERVRSRSGQRRASVLLVVDQAEELVTLANSDDRTAFLTLLAEAVRRAPWLWVVVVLRSDFLTGLLATGGAEVFQQPIVLGPLRRQHLYEVIERPAAQAGLRFEPPGLVARMVDDTGDGDALPLLAYTLSELWLRSRPGSVITERMYEDLGGVGGALAQRASRVVGELLTVDPKAPVIPTLLAFVTVADGGTPTRNRVLLASLNEADRRVAEAFVDARLLITGCTADTGETTIHVAHEALFASWPPLRQAIEERMAHLQLRHRVEGWASEWAESERQSEYLLRGERLRSVQQWVAADPELASQFPLVTEFLAVSSRFDEASAKRAADATAAAALEVLRLDPEASLLAALAAINEYAPTPLAHQALLAALMVCPVRGVLPGHTGPVTTASWSPDGTRLLTSSEDGTVRVWDAVDGALRLRLDSFATPVVTASWAPDGTRFAAAGRDVSVWDATDGTELGRLTGEGGPVRALDWSPDGHLIAFGGDNGRVSVCAVEPGGSRTDVAAHDLAVTALQWSPDGTRLASGSLDRTIAIRNATDLRELVRISGSARRTAAGEGSGHAGVVTSLAWSPDGTQLASASDDWFLRTWSAESGAALRFFQGHDDSVLGIVWSPDGARLASCSSDRTVRLWDAADGRVLAVLRSHAATVTGVSWSSRQPRLATASEDGTARIWTTDPSVLSGHSTWVRAVSWTPDGRRLASASFDGTVRIWDRDRRVQVATLRLPGSEVVFVTWSPDGSRVAATSSDGTVRVWREGEERPCAELVGHDALVTWVAWSPDGTSLVSSSLDRTVRFWDTANGRERAKLAYPDAVTWAAWSPDGKRLAVAVRCAGVYIHNPQHAPEPAVLLDHNEDVWGAAWSPDGHQLSTAAYDHTAHRWDTQSGVELGVLRGHDDAVCAVTWSPDGTRLATTSRDRTLRIWDARTDTEEMVLRGHEDVIWGLSWSPDGRTIATASDDQTVRLWPADTGLDAALAEAEGYAVRPLTAAERARFLLPPVPKVELFNPVTGPQTHWRG